MSQSNIITRTHINLVKEKKEGSDLLGFANVTFGGIVEVKGFKVRKNDNGIFVSFPSKAKIKDGKIEKWLNPDTGKEQDSYEQIVHAPTDDGKNLLKTAILNAYSAAVAEAKAKVASE
jgi:DNA-binding cell septation regulator SpoVG